MDKVKILKCIGLILISGLEIVAIAVNLFMLYTSVVILDTAILFNVILIPISCIIGFLVSLINGFIMLYIVGQKGEELNENKK